MADNVLQRLRDKAGLKRKEPSKPLTEAELDAKAKERRANPQRGHTKPVPEYKESYADADTASLDATKVSKLPSDTKGLLRQLVAKEAKLADAKAGALAEELELLEARKDEYTPEDYEDAAKALRYDLHRQSWSGYRATPTKMLAEWEHRVELDKLSKKDIRKGLRLTRNTFGKPLGELPDLSGGRLRAGLPSPLREEPSKTFKDFLLRRIGRNDEELTSMGLSGDVGMNEAGEQIITKNQQRLIDRGNRGVDKATGLPKPVAPSTPSRAEAMARKPSQYDMPIVDPATGLPVNVNGSMAVEEVRNLMGLHRSLEQRKRDMNEIRSYLDKTMPTPSPVPRPL